LITDCPKNTTGVEAIRGRGTGASPSAPGVAVCEQPCLIRLGAGAVFPFEIKGGRPAGKAFIESLRIFSHLANVGDAKSLVIHPATTTHYRMSDADLQKAGITAGTVRLSIGLEDPQDLIDDLDRALKVAMSASAK
jgi:O-acetylhomoserine (thiol)-lyase